MYKNLMLKFVLLTLFSAVSVLVSGFLLLLFSLFFPVYFSFDEFLLQPPNFI